MRPAFLTTCWQVSTSVGVMTAPVPVR
jgi:hypothetical protein